MPSSAQSEPDDLITVVVGRVGRPHGVRGDVTVEVRTDEPDRRFRPGAVLLTQPAGGGSGVVTVASRRWHSGRLLVHFGDVDGREGAEALRGTVLLARIDPDERPSDPDEYYDHQLVGLSVVDRSGQTLGQVVRVVHGAQDLLVVQRGSAAESLVPFVRALVPEVDLPNGRIVTDLPGGLLDGDTDWAD